MVDQKSWRYEIIYVDVHVRVRVLSQTQFAVTESAPLEQQPTAASDW